MWRSEKGQEMAEFGPALYIFLIVVFFPLLSFFSFLWGMSILAITANVCARDAGTASTFGQAQQNVTNQFNEFMRVYKGLAGFTPDGGPTLQVQTINIASGEPTNTSTGILANVDTDQNFYIWQVQIKGNIRPLFWPLQDLPVQYSATSNVEHPEGLTDATQFPSS